MPIRKIGVVTRTYRHVNRYRQILTVLVRYGFDDLINRLKIGHYLEIGLDLIARRAPEQTERLSTPERIRRVLEELGPTFIKLGQVLSTRPDLIPAELAVELSKLQQEVPPFAFDEARQIVESELDRPLDELFEHFESEALAAASIGQVHRARLRNGEEVVVKVQRPHIASTVEVDLEILLHLSTLLERHVEEAELHRPTRIVEEFTRVIESELDYQNEAAHVERFAALFNHDPTVYVPKVFRDLTTHRVITLEYVDVIPTTDDRRLDAAGLDRHELAARGADLALRQVFLYGFFHADPHPGNVFALTNNVICLLDFGMMGRLSRHTREQLAQVIYAVARRDSTAASSALLRLAEQDEAADLDSAQLERDVAAFIDLHVPTRLSTLDLGTAFAALFDLLGRNRLRLPVDIVTTLKALASVEQLATRLDPDLNLIAKAEPYLRRILKDRLRPTRLMREVVESGAELIDLSREIPRNLRDVTRLAKRGKLSLGFKHDGLGGFIDSNERIANRVSFAIVVAALIVGSSLIVHSQIPPKWFDIPLIGLAGYLVAGVMGLLLLVSILRHGRM